MTHEADHDPRTLARSLTEQLGVSASFASELARNKRKPSLELAVKIEDVLSIPARWWIKRDAGGAA
jgi:transcriptional regulator with XRE-family HTH domain